MTWYVWNSIETFCRHLQMHLSYKTKKYFSLLKVCLELVVYPTPLKCQQIFIWYFLFYFLSSHLSFFKFPTTGFIAPHFSNMLFTGINLYIKPWIIKCRGMEWYAWHKHGSALTSQWSQEEQQLQHNKYRWAQRGLQVVEFPASETNCGLLPQRQIASTSVGKRFLCTLGSKPGRRNTAELFVFDRTILTQILIS